MGLNVYGDRRTLLSIGHGVDIASQRADDLDAMALRRIESLVEAGCEYPFAIDVASGAGGQAIRMAMSGADVLAIDSHDFSSEVYAGVSQNELGGRVSFLQWDMRELCDLNFGRSADIIVCQRAIHYFTYPAAVDIVAGFAGLIRDGGFLYLSASGIHSELGENYCSSNDRLEIRYAELSAVMQEKHGILGPVCLYSEDDLVSLLSAAGFDLESVYSSAFGNIKAVGRKRVQR